MKAQKTLDAVDKASLKLGDNEHRTHLGASVIGHECGRYLWYHWRWCGKEEFPARLLRLFERGQRQEVFFEDLLKIAGITTWCAQEDGSQFRFSAINGHFGGSLDGVANGVPDVPAGTPCLLEMKTKNDRQFKILNEQGVVGAEYKHFAQMQLYMDAYELDYALYMVVNKNDDDLYLEIVKRDPYVAKMLLEKAEEVIWSEKPLPKISNKPGWWKCRFCCYKGICHYPEKNTIERNCRTCKHSRPTQEGEWHCFLKNTALNKQAQLAGCDSHEYLQSFKA